MTPKANEAETLLTESAAMGILVTVRKLKALYGAIFDYIVERVNGSISKQNSSVGKEDTGAAGSVSIGVLDIFGFEIFNSNNFVQLCIDYTNETVS